METDMANITASMVKDLRDKTGAGMMDCKNALNETGGDMEAAIDWLRKKGISKAAKKSGRAAAEGLVGVAVDANTGVLLEVNAETDLVAKIDENMTVRRAAALSVNPGVVAAYVHNASSPELGNIGVLVGLKSTADKDKLSALAKQLAMHVAAAAPLALTKEHLDKAVVEREY